MRLLNVHTLEFGEFFETEVPRYSILSHRWGKNVLFYKQYRKSADFSGPGYQKIVDFCLFIWSRAVKPRFHLFDEGTVDWVWIDTINCNPTLSAWCSSIS